METYNNLNAARASHYKNGGFLLDLDGIFMVADENMAIEMREGGIDYLLNLAPTYDETQQPT